MAFTVGLVVVALSNEQTLTSRSNAFPTDIDKTTLAYAAVFDLKKDLKLTGDQYVSRANRSSRKTKLMLIGMICMEQSWLGSIFYFGWLAWGQCFTLSYLVGISAPGLIGSSLLAHSSMLRLCSRANQLAYGCKSNRIH